MTYRVNGKTDRRTTCFTSADPLASLIAQPIIPIKPISQLPRHFVINLKMIFLDFFIIFIFGILVCSSPRFSFMVFLYPFSEIIRL